MADADEHRFALHGVPWSAYSALRDALDGHSSLKMTCLNGALELMRPSRLHAETAAVIARLIEVWAMEHDADLRGFGGATFRREAKERGLEPDERYKLGELRDDGVPDIAIEVIVTSALVDTMAVYAGLGVAEVWVWRPTIATLAVHRLVGDRYELRERSAVLPALDVSALARFVQPGQNQTALAKAYRASLRAPAR